MFVLNELQQDAMLEIFNIGVGKAAAALSKMTLEDVLLSVPTIEFLEWKEARLHLPNDGTIMCGISQRFEGPFNTEAVLMFPEEKSIGVIRHILGVDSLLEQLTEMEQEGLCEIGNIVLNACMAQIADIFSAEFHATLPELRIGTSEHVLNMNVEQPDRVVMLMRVKLTMERQETEGYLAFLSVLSDIQRLTSNVDRFICELAK
jgi:chemotaxis protein CheC